MSGIYDEGGDRTAFDNLPEQTFLFVECLLGALLLSDILQGFDGTDHATVGVAQGSCRKEEPASSIAEAREEILGLVGAIEGR